MEETWGGGGGCRGWGRGWSEKNGARVNSSGMGGSLEGFVSVCCKGSVCLY